jgi:hypothetical protein
MSTAHLITRRVARCAQQATPHIEQTATKGSADARLTPPRVGGGGAFQVMRCILEALEAEHDHKRGENGLDGASYPEQDL